MSAVAPPENLLRQARVLKALAHPARLTMVHALAHGERCVCDLRNLVGSDVSTVSKHLSVLKRAGLVADRKQGLWVHYRLRMACVLEFLACMDSAIAEVESCTPGRATACRR